jgi:LysM repeat protein
MQMSNDRDQTNPNSDQTRPAEQPVRSVPDQPPVRSQPVQTADQPVEIRHSVPVVVEREESNLGEYIKFVILALILLGTPVVIALISPLIFEQIVPAVLGANLPANPPPVNVPGDQVVEPEMEGTPGPVLPTDPQTGIGGEATTAAYPAAPQPTPTDIRYHIVQRGDTLDAIARQHGLTSAELAAANNIQNPNHIQSGTVLIIPPPSNP